MTCCPGRMVMRATLAIPIIMVSLGCQNCGRQVVFPCGEANPPGSPTCNTPVPAAIEGPRRPAPPCEDTAPPRAAPPQRVVKFIQQRPKVEVSPPEDICVEVPPPKVTVITSP